MWKSVTAASCPQKPQEEHKQKTGSNPEHSCCKRFIYVALQVVLSEMDGIFTLNEGFYYWWTLFGFTLEFSQTLQAIAASHMVLMCVKCC